MNLPKAAALLLLVIMAAAALPILSACHFKDPGTPSGPVLTTPYPSRTDERPLLIPEDSPLTEEEAARVAATFDLPLETYDLLRPGGAVDLSRLEEVEIFRVVDGDTLIVMRDDRPVRLRLNGLDAPESYSHHDETMRTHRGESVSRLVSAWLTGRQAYLQFDVESTDPYERLLVYVWLDAHTMVNEVLVREGLAWQHRYPPNTKFNDYFEELEKMAKQEGRGIWGDGKKNLFGYDESNQRAGSGKDMNQKTIYLAGGCFWGVERYYQLLPAGILKTEAGYANGTGADPSYEEVCRGNTGFAETVRVVYDPGEISLTAVLAHFFRIIDPTTRDHQGNDYGDQYRP
ncbi:MAG: peptide-methionine (S)-S-oxide reductase MsrA, partial [Clostridiaceae bacterium]|nr:peptide-methionine (S)-S-oxide reductase MsrA [Clostridiaceae bacterium]